MEKIILIGGGGHAKSIIDSIKGVNKFDIAAIIEKKDSEEKLYSLYEAGVKNAFIAVGSIGYPYIRIKLYKQLKKIGYSFPNIIDKTAIISSEVILEEGVFIGKGAIINSGVTIKKQCIINSGTIVEHDCRIDKFVHLAPGTTLSGGVTIGEGTHVGTNSTVIQNIKIGKHVLIGAGSVIVSDVKDNIKLYGNPGREVEAYE